MLKVCGETMFLQQSCLWLEGWQGIVRQHFMACWSADMAWHSESCITKATLAATRNDVILRNIRSGSLTNYLS